MDLLIKEDNTVNKYDEILANMGIYFENGQMKSIDNFEILTQDPPKSKTKQSVKKSEIISEAEKATLQNSYIYNKYFNEYIKPAQEQIILPQDPEERKQFLRQKYIEDQRKRQEIARIKSTKMIYGMNTTTSANVSRLGSIINFKMF
jgi:hypothetical protein